MTLGEAIAQTMDKMISLGEEAYSWRGKLNPEDDHEWKILISTINEEPIKYNIIVKKR